MDEVIKTKIISTVINLKKIGDEISHMKEKVNEYKKVSDEEKIKEWDEMYTKYVEREIVKREDELKELEKLDEVQSGR